MMKMKTLSLIAVLGVLATGNVMAAEHKHSKHVTPNKHVVSKQIVAKPVVTKKVVTKKVVTNKAVTKQIVIKQVVKTPYKQPSKKVAHHQHNKNVTVIVRR